MEKRQISFLHNNNKNYFTIATNNYYWKQYYFNNVDEIEINLKGNDVYVSQNSFNQKSRKLIHLAEIKALYIDIDCYNKKISKEAVKYFLENDLYGEIPIPNFLIDSGRGLYYIILLENTSAKDLPKWQLVEKYLFDKLEHLGADAKCLDATRVLRVIGSKNSKTRSLVQIIDECDYKYTLDEIIENYVPDVYIDTKKNVLKKHNKTKTIGVRKKNSSSNNYYAIFNTYTLYYNRMIDIQNLVKIRNGECKGYRETILFLYRYFSSVYYKSEEEALNNTLELNNLFSEPLSLKEATEATASGSIGATEMKYKYSNDKLIKLLDIKAEEQKELYTIISKEEKYRRNNKQRYNKKRNEEGLTKKQLEKQEKLEKVRKLMGNYTINEIVEITNISKRSVSRYIKEIREKE